MTEWAAAEILKRRLLEQGFVFFPPPLIWTRLIIDDETAKNKVENVVALRSKKWDDGRLEFCRLQEDELSLFPAASHFFGRVRRR